MDRLSASILAIGFLAGCSVIALGPRQAPHAERLGPYLDKFSAALESHQAKQAAAAKVRNDLLRNHYDQEAAHRKSEDANAERQRELWAAQAGEARARTNRLQVRPGLYQVIRATEKEVFLLNTWQGDVVKRELK